MSVNNDFDVKIVDLDTFDTLNLLFDLYYIWVYISLIVNLYLLISSKSQL